MNGHQSPQHFKNSRNSWIHPSFLVFPWQQSNTSRFHGDDVPIHTPSFVQSMDQYLAEHLFPQREKENKRYSRIPVQIALPCRNEDAEFTEQLLPSRSGDTSSPTNPIMHLERDPNDPPTNDNTQLKTPLVRIHNTSFQLISSHEVHMAISHGHFRPMDCSSCQLELLVIEFCSSEYKDGHDNDEADDCDRPRRTVDYMICPDCHEITKIRHHSDTDKKQYSESFPIASVGFTMSTLQQFQLEQQVLMEKQQITHEKQHRI